MSCITRFRVLRGTTAQRLTFTPLDGELFWDTTASSMYVGDGVTVGGVGIAQTALDGKENTGVAASLVASHEAAPDPHPQYETSAEAQAKVDAHANLTDNPHSVTKSQVGLGNVDNTSDADKPISTATQEALDLKVSSDTTGVTGADQVTNMISLTQAEYDAIVTKNGSTFYLITDAV